MLDKQETYLRCAAIEPSLWSADSPHSARPQDDHTTTWYRAENGAESDLDTSYSPPPPPRLAVTRPTFLRPSPDSAQWPPTLQDPACTLHARVTRYHRSTLFRGCPLPPRPPRAREACPPLPANQSTSPSRRPRRADSALLSTSSNTDVAGRRRALPCPAPDRAPPCRAVPCRGVAFAQAYTKLLVCGRRVNLHLILLQRALSRMRCARTRTTSTRARRPAGPQPSRRGRNAWPSAA